MIIGIEEIMSLDDFSGQKEQDIKRKLDALEIMVRKYTNNNFQNRNIRFIGSSEDNKINGCHPFIRVGDTIQISSSEVNDGLYVVSDIADNCMIVDAELFPIENNLVTKIEYPKDVQEGVLNLMKWEIHNRKKVGIQSETLSRHSVTYFNQDGNNQVNGYPASLMGFLKPYMKAR